jgi:hypothetical protein
MNYMANLSRLKLIRRNGSERFHAGGHVLGFDLLDFWQWSVSDLMSNATRGRLAEYIAARALNLPTTGVRNEWAAFELQTAEGTKVEVKSAAYIQSWHQNALSRISFEVPKTKPWDPDTNRQGQEASRQADVYVFALLAHQDKATVDPLDLSQWQFFVVPTKKLNDRTRSQHSITVKSLQALAEGPLGFHSLADAVRQAAETQDHG